MYLRPEKVPLSGGVSPHRHYRIEYPPPPLPTPPQPLHQSVRTSTCVRFPLSLALTLSVRKMSISAGIRERAPGDLDLLNVPIRQDTFKEFNECNYYKRL